MATVTTPSGERLEGVTGQLLEYYRGEANTVGGYLIEDDESAVTFPRVFDPELHGDEYAEPNADLQEHPGFGEQMVGYSVPPGATSATLDTTTDPATATAEVDGKHIALSPDDPAV